MKFLIKNSSLVPMVRDHEVLACDLLIADGIIQKIAPDLAADSSTTVIDAKDCLTLPGFIQGHIHLVQTLLRHNADDLELLDWLKERTWPYEAAIDEDAVEAASLLGISELLLGGTTTICDYGTTHSHEKVFQAVDQMGLRYIGGKTMMNHQGAPGRLFETSESSLQETTALGKKWHNHDNGRIKYAVTPRFALSCTEELMRECVRLARENKWYLQTHFSENLSEIAAVEKITGRKNVEYLYDLGFVGEDTILAHGVHVSAGEMNLLEKTKTRICHCPGSNLKLASGIADIPLMLERKIPVMLGADGAPCNNRLSIFHEMALAATIHKVKFGPRAMPAWEVLKMATVDAARALRLDNEIGTLEVGKKADVVILSRESLSMQPAGDVASQIVYGAQSSDVKFVFIDGKLLVENGSLLIAQKSEVIEKAVRAWSRVQEKMKSFI